MRSKNPNFFVALMGMALLLLSFTFVQTKPWNVPESARNVKNPVKADAESIAIGKALFAKHCRSCHGKDGEGDGPKAAELETFPGDLTTAEFQGQTDGALFYKTTQGRDDMPSFAKKVSDEDRWILVNYLRILKK